MFNILGKRVKFYSHNINALPPTPKSYFRHLKQGTYIQEFYKRYVLVPADRAANNVDVVCRLQYINTLKQELKGTKAYKETFSDEETAVNRYLNGLSFKLDVNVKERQDKLPRLPKLQEDHMELVSLSTLALALLGNRQNN